MKVIKIQMFPKNGAINEVFNAFATFIFNRKSESALTEAKFVKKLKAMQGATNTPMSLLTSRIEKGEIDYSKIAWANNLIKEMISIIKKHDK
jgi:hypothetical protein